MDILNGIVSVTKLIFKVFDKLFFYGSDLYSFSICMPPHKVICLQLTYYGFSGYTVVFCTQ